MALKRVFRPRALTGVKAVKVFCSDDFSGTGELRVIDIKGIVDDRYHYAFTLGQDMGCLDIGAGIDLRLIGDGGFLQVPLVVMDRSALPRAQYFRVAVVDILTFEQLKCE